MPMSMSICSLCPRDAFSLFRLHFVGWPWNGLPRLLLSYSTDVEPSLSAPSVEAVARGSKRGGGGAASSSVIVHTKYTSFLGTSDTSLVYVCTHASLEVRHVSSYAYLRESRIGGPAKWCVWYAGMMRCWGLRRALALYSEGVTVSGCTAVYDAEVFPNA